MRLTLSVHFLIPNVNEDNFNSKTRPSHLILKMEAKINFTVNKGPFLTTVTQGVCHLTAMYVKTNITYVNCIKSLAKKYSTQ